MPGDAWRGSALACLVLALGLLAGATACSRTSAADLPPAPGLLQDAAGAMAGVTSTTFDLEVSGDLSGLPIGGAQGSIQRGGLAQGSLSIGGADFPFRLLKGTFYLQNPDHSWVSSPPAYDPSVLLDPTTGFAGLLAGATSGRTVAEESAGGVATDKVFANVPDDLIKQLSDLAPGQSSLRAALWISVQDHRLVKFAIPFRAPDTQGPTTVTVTLKDFNRPVVVTAPKA